MIDNLVVIDKKVLENRVELIKSFGRQTSELNTLKYILEHSKELKPILSDCFDAGFNHAECKTETESKEDYLSTIKL